ncbi:hypothetical protein, partial [Enterobacter hormaechei]|uniref:hypothetical protein n=1 Tax=Enterobacter hormaechei TaxID=158836 RepID=UPI001BD472B1
VRVFVYSMATVLFLPLGLLKSTWWFSPLFAIAAIDYLMFLRRLECALESTREASLDSQPATIEFLEAEFSVDFDALLS